MRLRSQSNDAVNSGMSVTTVLYETGKSPVTTTTSYSAGCNSSTSTKMLDVVTGNFRKRSSHGEVIMNPMVRISSDIITSGSLSYTLQTDKRANQNAPFQYYSHSVTTTSGFLPRFRIPITPLALSFNTSEWDTASSPFHLGDLSEVGSNLVALARAKAAESDASALVTMAELDKTFDMFYNGAKSAHGLVTQLKRAKKDDVRRLASLPMRLIKEAVRNPIAAKKKFLRGASDSFFHLASMWLGYRYGIMATYYDVESWVSAFSDRRSKPRNRYVVSKISSYDSGTSTSQLSQGLFTTNYLSTRYTRHTRSSCGVLVTMLEEADPSYTLGMRNILSSAWELVPFSFVLDWFLDAGTRLQALDSGFVRPVLGSWVTHRSTLTTTKNYYAVGRGYVVDGNSRYSAPALDNWALVNDVTTLTERIANPPLSPIPAVKINLNFKKIVDGVALIRPASMMLSDLLEPR